MIKAVLFDLDGTLVPMDQDVFVKCYFKELAAKMAAYGYESGKLIETVWLGTKAMLKNDGSKSNEAAFWECFAGVYGAESLKDVPNFDDFYRNEFSKIKDVCGFDPQARNVITALKEQGYRVALATSPIFPPVAAEVRIKWADLTVDDFELCTTYSNCRYCKPNPGYYMDIADSLGLLPEECLMVGNDVSDDMPAENIGMKVFLLTTCLINKENKDISAYPHGDFDDLMRYIETEC